MFRVVEHEGEQLVRENDAVAPVGKPAVENETG
jgi:hypothetical protein